MRSRRRMLQVVIALLAGGLMVRVFSVLRPPRVGVAPEWAVLANVTIINPGDERRAAQTITMRHGRIESITDVADSRPTSMAHVFRDRYVLPGLIDTNVRLPSFPGLRQALGVYFLYAGVTTVRDVGNFAGDLAQFLRRLDGDEIPWPRLVACGQVLEGDPPVCSHSRVVREASDAAPAIAALAAAGARCIRVHDSVASPVRAAIRTAAQAHGLAVIEPREPTAPVEPGLAPAADHWLSRFRTLTPSGGEVFSPSLLPWVPRPQNADPSTSTDPVLAFMPRAYRPLILRHQADMQAAAAGCAAGGAPPSAECTGGPTDPLALLIGAAKQLHDRGARMVLGTGTPFVYAPPGFAAHQEMAWLQAAGLSLEEVWVAATRSAGEALSIPQLGVIEAGAPADLLVFREDPTRDLRALNTLEAVVLRGRLYMWQARVHMAMDHIKYFQGLLYDWGTRVWMWLIEWWNPQASRGCAAL